jgi:Zn finger protein HypA/HybF involved in hydrogenase expression
MPEILSRDEIEARLTSYEDCPVRLDPAEQGEIRALLTAKKRDEQLDEARTQLNYRVAEYRCQNCGGIIRIPMEIRAGAIGCCPGKCPHCGGRAWLPGAKEEA